MDKVKIWILIIIAIGGLIMLGSGFRGGINNIFDNARTYNVGVAEDERILSSVVYKRGSENAIDLSSTGTYNVAEITHESKTGKVLVIFNGDVSLRERTHSSPTDNVGMEIWFDLKKDGGAVDGTLRTITSKTELTGNYIEEKWDRQAVSFSIIDTDVGKNTWKVEAQVQSTTTDSKMNDRILQVMDI